MKEHFCPAEKSIITYQGECSWCGEKEALAQTQEPFAWAEFDGEGSYFLRLYENNETYAEDWNKRNPNHIGWVEPIYKYPPQRIWVGLTEQERNDLEDYCEMIIGKAAFDAIEAKLKQKNGYAEEKNT